MPDAAHDVKNTLGLFSLLSRSLKAQPGSQQVFDCNTIIELISTEYDWTSLSLVLFYDAHPCCRPEDFSCVVLFIYLLLFFARLSGDSCGPSSQAEPSQSCPTVDFPCPPPLGVLTLFHRPCSSPCGSHQLHHRSRVLLHSYEQPRFSLEHMDTRGYRCVGNAAVRKFTSAWDKEWYWQWQWQQWFSSSSS